MRAILFLGGKDEWAEASYRYVGPSRAFSVAYGYFRHGADDNEAVVYPPHRLTATEQYEFA